MFINAIKFSLMSNPNDIIIRKIKAHLILEMDFLIRIECVKMLKSLFEITINQYKLFDFYSNYWVVKRYLSFFALRLRKRCGAQFEKRIRINKYTIT